MNNLADKSDKKYSFVEYMTMEETNTERHDFYHGEIFAMAVVKARHHLICQNINACLLNRFKPDGCFVSMEGVRLEFLEEDSYLYPDLFVTCDEKDKKMNYIKNIHPSFLKFYLILQHCMIKK